MFSQYGSQEGVEKYKRRCAAGRKAHETRKTRLVEWWKQVRSDNPRVQEIVKRLWQIGETISELHDEKQRCREDDSGDDSDEYLEFGAEHCDRCAKMTQTQEELRGERESLFTALEDACGKDRRRSSLPENTTERNDG